MADDGRFERQTELLRNEREKGDRSQVTSGSLAARLERWYGRGAIAKAALSSGYRRSSLYEHAAVWSFYLNTHDGLRMSASRILNEWPWVTYTHLRDAMTLENFGEALDALLAANDGDPRFKQFNISLPMGSEAFAVYVAFLAGRPVAPVPLFDETGLGWEIHNKLIIFASRWRDRRVRVTVREVR